MVRLNHISWAGSDSGKPVIRWSVSRLEALPGGTNSPSISPRPQWAGAKNRPGNTVGYSTMGQCRFLGKLLQNLGGYPLGFKIAI